MSNVPKVTVSFSGRSHLADFYASRRAASPEPQREVSTYAFNGTDTFTTTSSGYRTIEQLRRDADNSVVMRLFDWIFGK